MSGITVGSNPITEGVCALSYRVPVHGSVMGSSLVVERIRLGVVKWIYYVGELVQMLNLGGWGR